MPLFVQLRLVDAELRVRRAPRQQAEGAVRVEPPLAGRRRRRLPEQLDDGLAIAGQMVHEHRRGRRPESDGCDIPQPDKLLAAGDWLARAADPAEHARPDLAAIFARLVLVVDRCW